MWWREISNRRPNSSSCLKTRKGWVVYSVDIIFKVQHSICIIYRVKILYFYFWWLAGNAVTIKYETGESVLRRTLLAWDGFNWICMTIVFIIYFPLEIYAPSNEDLKMLQKRSKSLTIEEDKAIDEWYIFQVYNKNCWEQKKISSIKPLKINTICEFLKWAYHFSIIQSIFFPPAISTPINISRIIIKRKTHLYQLKIFFTLTHWNVIGDDSEVNVLKRGLYSRKPWNLTEKKKFLRTFIWKYFLFKSNNDNKRRTWDILSEVHKMWDDDSLSFITQFELQKNNINRTNLISYICHWTAVQNQISL